MISKQQIPVAGLQLTVYGLEEYKSKGSQGPVAVMFAMHGRLRKHVRHEHIGALSYSVCRENECHGPYL